MKFIKCEICGTYRTVETKASTPTCSPQCAKTWIWLEAIRYAHWHAIGIFARDPNFKGVE